MSELAQNYFMLIYPLSCRLDLNPLCLVRIPNIQLPGSRDPRDRSDLLGTAMHTVLGIGRSADLAINDKYLGCCVTSADELGADARLFDIHRLLAFFLSRRHSGVLLFVHSR